VGNWLGCLKDPPDGRDYNARVKLAERAVALEDMPTYVDLRDLCPSIRSQGGLGACVAFACTAMREFILGKQIQALQGYEEAGEAKVKHLSPLDLYYRARQAMGPEYLNQDSGTYVRLGMDMLRAGGCLTEERWPYVVADFAKAPPADHADRFKLFTYWRIPLGTDSLDLIKQALAQEYGVVLAVMVFSNVMGPLGPIPLEWEWPMPDPNKDVLVGWHALFLDGYWEAPGNPSYGWFLVHNSWGENWVMDGHAWMPYQYIAKGYWSDAWVGVA
jgi:C1A family cysteine protease